MGYLDIEIQLLVRFIEGVPYISRKSTDLFCVSCLAADPTELEGVLVDDFESLPLLIH
jgi:hypothetical protein